MTTNDPTIVGGKLNLLLAVTGSVAAVKVPALALKLQPLFNVRIILSNPAEHFLAISKDYDPESHNKFQEITTYQSSLGVMEMKKLAINDVDGEVSAGIVIYRDEDEWKPYQSVKSDPVLHIELRKWADLLVVCPLTANSLAKIANGLADNLLTCVIRAWDLPVKSNELVKDVAPTAKQYKPIIMCPAMNTLMWNNPFTAEHLRKLDMICNQQNGARKYSAKLLQIVEPVSKVLACGDEGKGALASIETILAAINQVVRDYYPNNI